MGDAYCRVVIEVDNGKTVSQELEKREIKALEAMGLHVERFAKMYCPVDTGRLRNSIAHALYPENKSVRIGTDVFYAIFVELGTIRQRANPFLMKSVTNHMDNLRKIAKSILE